MRSQVSTRGLAIGMCLIAACSCGRDAPRQTPLPASEPPSGWRIYGDVRLRFSIAYPEGWGVDRQYVYPIRIGGSELHGVAFSVPEWFRAKTNLARDTRISVEGLPNAANCDARLFLDSPQSELTENDGGYTWSIATGGDAGAGNFYDETVYALVGSHPCVAIRYFIHSTNIANYDPGTVKEFDRTALVTMFDRIRGTFAPESAGGAMED